MNTKPVLEIRRAFWIGILRLFYGKKNASITSVTNSVQLPRTGFSQWRYRQQCIGSHVPRLTATQEFHIFITRRYKNYENYERQETAQAINDFGLSTKILLTAREFGKQKRLNLQVL